MGWRGIGVVCLLATLLGALPEIAGYAQTTRDHALHTAAMKGDVKRVRSLLAGGAKVDAKLRKEGFTPLAFAATNGHAAVLQALLDKGAAVDGRSTDGKTPLMLAAMWGYTDAVRVLLAAGARVDLKDTTGKTAMAYAQEGKTPALKKVPHGHLAVIRLLEGAHSKPKKSRK